MNEDKVKNNRYNEHITNLENLFISVNIKGTYEDFRFAPCFMLFSFIDLLRSVAILDNSHMITAGNIIIRSMFEILVDFLYCETDKKLYERFGKYQSVNRVNLYNELSEDLKNKVNKEKYENNILKEFDAFKEKYNITKKNELYNWSGLSVKEMVNIISKDVPEIKGLFLNIYKTNCEYTHPSSTSICEYAKLLDKKVKVSYEQKYNKDKYLLIRQINSMVEIFYNKFNDNYANKKLTGIDF